jgi:hypothetical protein
MPTWKRIVILANSIKRHHRCVAGKEVTWDGAQWRIGSWIRPIDRSDAEGAVALNVMRCEDGGFPDVLDIVDVPLLQPANDANHPEDWVLDTGQRWKRAPKFPAAGINLLVDSPATLWSHPAQPRKVPEGYVSSMPGPASLYLVRPPAKWEFLLFRDTAWRDGLPTEQKRIRSRLVFSLGGQQHAFDINDPHWGERYCQHVSVPETGSVVVPVAYPDAIFLTLSLTPAFKGWHYKILAAVIEGGAS